MPPLHVQQEGAAGHTSLATAFNHCYGSRVGFSEEARELARELARKAQAEQQKYGPETPLEMVIRRTQWITQKFFEEVELPHCVDKLISWFDDVGMLPHPPLDSGERKERFQRHYDSGYERFETISVYYVEITWWFDGYDYRASCPGTTSSLAVEINVEGRWFDANTREAIGWALLQERK
jgi:hypothetical protein